MKRKTVVFFRGRNTAGIMEDAQKLGVSDPMDTIRVFCRPGDALAGPNDRIAGLTSAEILLSEAKQHAAVPTVVVVANGGTTSQLVPVLLYLARAQDVDLKVVEVGRDEVTSFT